MVRAGLAVFLALWTPVQAAEPAFDALSHLLREYAGPVDAAAAEATPEAEAPAGERLAQVSADLALMAEGLELFRAPAHAEAALVNLPDHVIPELRPFFKDRDAALLTIYRTLAVTDYTWASRFPEPGCEPRERRAALLAADDGLFADDQGGLSPWLARLLGPAAVGRSATEALDRASSRSATSGRDYERLRAKAAKISAALRSEKAQGRERAKLYCLRAETYESLAEAHRASRAPITAGLSLGEAADSVVALAWAANGKAPRVVGAGTMVETADGPRLLTDARLKPAEDGVLSAITRGRDGGLGSAYPVIVASADDLILVGRVPAISIPALRLASGPAVEGDFFRALGHLSAAGLWTTTQGLVTETRESAFASDALVGPDLVGGPMLNDAGEVVGLIILTPGGAPVALRPETLRRALAGAVVGPVELPSASHTGTASLLTTARPITGDLPGAGGEAVEAGLPSSLGGVNWEGGGGVGNWRPRSSAGPPRSYSSYSGSSGSSSYSSSDSGGAELGRALGQALAPLVEALIFRGIPALFRGIASLFKSKPKSQSTQKMVALSEVKKIEQQKEEEKLPDPKLTLTLLPAEAFVTSTQPLTLTARVSGNRKDLKLDGHVVEFRVNGVDVSTSATATTDASGVALLTITIPAAAIAHKNLDVESAKHPWLTNAAHTQAAHNVCQVTVMAAEGALVITATIYAPQLALAGGGRVVASATLSQGACAAIGAAWVASAKLACDGLLGKEIADVKPAPHSAPAPQGQGAAKASGPMVAAAAERGQRDLDSEAAKHAMSEWHSTPGEPNEPPDDDEKELERPSSVRMTAKEAEKAAKELGYDKKIPAHKAPFNSHGRPVFQSGNKYITPDADGHNGGVWKMFNRAGQRLGTYDKNLVWIGK
ncbi:MAG: toxin C-terminal domain-containing protein [Elusimicrobiota bacterium]|nr:MAG: toxin C-terminal domain-containing protein [Elusimicrobiota bacterium]